MHCDIFGIPRLSNKKLDMCVENLQKNEGKIKFTFLMYILARNLYSKFSCFLFRLPGFFPALQLIKKENVLRWWRSYLGQRFSLFSAFFFFLFLIS